MDEDVLKDLFAAEPHNEDIAEALAKILAKSEQWDALAQHLLERLENNVGSRVHLYRRLAEVMNVHLGLPDNALVVLLEAFRELEDDTLLGDPIAQLAEELGQWNEVLECYESAVTRSQSPLGLHRRLADWYGRLSDLSAEVYHRRAILDHDPCDEQAADALAAYYETTEDWARLAELYELRLQHCTLTARKAIIEQLAHIYAELLGRPNDALNAIAKIYQDEPTAQLRVRMEQYAELGQGWQTLLNAYNALPNKDLGGFATEADKHRRLAEICAVNLGQPKEARRHYAALLATGAWDSAAAATYRTLLRESGQQSELLERISVDLKHISDDEHRLALLVEQAAIQQSLGHVESAIQSWLAALDIKSDDKSVLMELMEAFRSTEQWQASVKVLKKLTVLETDLSRRAQFFHAIGVIERDKMEDVTSAARSFDRALEFDPRFVRAFHAIDELLDAEGDHERRDRYFRKMLVRSIENELDADFIVMLARQLGDLNRRILKNYQAALDAYEVALKHGAADRSLFKIVAELEAKLGDWKAAERTLLSLIESDPGETDCLHALVTLYSSNQDLDKAYCACRVLKIVGQATPEELALYESVKESASGRQVRPMNAQTWSLLESAIENPEVGQVLRFLTPALLEYVSRSERAVGVSTQNNKGLEHAQRLVALVAAILGRATPAIRISSRVDGVLIGHLAQPILVASSKLSKLSRSEQIVQATRSFVLLEPTYYLATLDRDPIRSIARLRKLMATVHQWLEPDRPQPDAMPELLNLLGALPVSDKSAFIEIIGTLKRFSDYGIQAWLDSVERMVTRLAFAISDDLASSVESIRRTEVSLGSATPQERILDLLAYAVSPEYHRLRERLALTLTP